MKQLSVELFGDEGNFATVRMPGRASAGVVFQLDSLGRLVGDIQEVIRLLREDQSTEALSELEATTNNWTYSYNKRRLLASETLAIDGLSFPLT